MSTQDSRPSDGRSEHKDASQRKNEHTQTASPGSPVPSEIDELQDPQSRHILKGEAYEAYGNDEDHKSANAPGNGAARGTEHKAANISKDAYGRDGPLAYERPGSGSEDLSDERIHELVCQRLTDNNHLMEIGKVSIEVSNGCVTLKGTVPDQHTKAAIEEAVGTCPHVQGMSTHLEVDSST